MRVWLGSVAVIVACTGEPAMESRDAAATRLHRDAGAGAGGVDAGDPSAPIEAGGDATVSDVCSARVQRLGYVEYAFSLSDLCALLAKDGRVACPSNRRTFVASSVDCSPATQFPVLRRHCGTDIYYYAPHPSLYVTWTFAAKSGALIAARVVGDGFPCGRGNYLSGPPFGACDENDVYCHLCESGPDRDLQCPSDVVAALPGKVCETPTTAPGCACANPGSTSFTDLPDEGTPCGAPTMCPNCQSGTCWASCVCAQDGVFRWEVDCTE